MNSTFGTSAKWQHRDERNVTTVTTLRELLLSVYKLDSRHIGWETLPWLMGVLTTFLYYILFWWQVKSVRVRNSCCLDTGLKWWNKIAQNCPRLKDSSLAYIKRFIYMSTLSSLAVAGGLQTELPHKQIFSLFSYFKNFLCEYRKGKHFMQFSLYLMT
jgi:hypothetical protein